MIKRIFISYRRKADAWAVGHLRDRLGDEFGVEHVFFDQSSIESGEDWLARLKHEIDRADAVVMVFGRSWYGLRDDQTRRIDDPDDPVSFELVRANARGVPIFPVVIDEQPPPGEDELPEALRFLLERQFRRLSAADSISRQFDRLILRIRGELFGQSRRWHFLRQAIWIAFVAVALVWLLRAGDLLGFVDDAFARTAQQLQTSRIGSLHSPPEFGIVEINNNEYAELFGGRSPLDAQVMAILIETIARSSQNGACGANRPVGIMIDLAQSAEHADLRDRHQLATALLALANCRPVVLVCPQAVERGLESPAPQWLEAITRDAGSGYGVTLASSLADAQVLRHSHARRELGAVMGDLAQSRAPFRGDALLRTCACPWRASDQARCNDARGTSDASAARLRQANELDRRSIVSPSTPVSQSAAASLRYPDDVTRNQGVLLGAAYGTQGRYSVADRGNGPVTGTLVQSRIAQSLAREPWSINKPLILAADLLGAVLVSSGLMWVWRQIAASPGRFAPRAFGYLRFALIFIGLPICSLAAAVAVPQALLLASNLLAVSIVTGLRSTFSGYEVVLNQGVAWKALPKLWQALLTERDKLSAAFHLGFVLLELLLIAAGMIAIIQF